MEWLSRKNWTTIIARDQSPDKVFTCSFCAQCFGYKHVLNNHERTHTGEKPYFCQICNRRFTRDHHLKTHMRQHTGEKPYNCTHCDKQFVQVSNLRRHVRVHTGERPYRCELCDSRFTDSNQLKVHMLKHNGQKPFRRRKHKHVKNSEDRPLLHSTTPISPPGFNRRRERKSSQTRRRIIRVAGFPIATVTSWAWSRNFSGSGSHSSISASPSPSRDSLIPYCHSVSSNEDKNGTAVSITEKNNSDEHRYHLTQYKCVKNRNDAMSAASNGKRERKLRKTRRIIRVAGLPIATVTSYLEFDSFVSVMPEQTQPKDLSTGSGGSHSSVSASPSPNGSSLWSLSF